MSGCARDLLLVGLLACGCARIQTREFSRDEPDHVDRRTEVIEGSARLTIHEPAVEGTTVRARLTISEECEVTTQTFVKRTLVSERTSSGYSPAWSCSVAAGWTGLGILAVNNYRDCNQEPTYVPYSGSNPRDDCVNQQASGKQALLVVGSLLWLPCLIDIVRAVDTETDHGVVGLTPDRTRSSCRERSVDDATVALRFMGGPEIMARTGTSGVARFPATGLPLAILPARGQAPIGAIRVGSTSAALELSAEAWRDLRSELLRDPSSRANRELESGCARGVASASERLASLASAKDRLAAAAAWNGLPGACDRAWTPAREASRAAAADRIAAAEQEDARRACEAALQHAEEQIPSRDLAADRQILDEAALRCARRADESKRVEALRERWLAAQKAAEELAAARARLARAREEAAAALRRGDGVRALEALQRAPELAADLRDQPETAAQLRELGLAAVRAQVDGQGKGGVPALCAAKALHRRLLGPSAWDELGRAATKQIGKGDAMEVSRVARALSAECR